MCGDLPRQAAITKVGPCTKRELVKVQAILESSPEASAWSGRALAETLEHCSPYFLLAWRGNEIAGFIVGRGIAGEGEILNLAVKPEHRRHGIGKSLLKALLELFASHNVRQVFLEVRESNTGAIAFYQDSGFHQVGRRASYYRGPVEAALIFAQK